MSMVSGSGCQGWHSRIITGISVRKGDFFVSTSAHSEVWTVALNCQINITFIITEIRLQRKIKFGQTNMETVVGEYRECYVH